MPKNKTHFGTRRRFWVTGSDELMHEQVNKRHLLEVKPPHHKCELSQDQPVAPTDVRQARKLLGR